MNGFQTQNESVGKDWKARSLSSGQQRTVPPALADTGDISCEEAGLGSRQTASSTELCQGGQSPNSGWSHFSPARSTTPDNARMQEEEDNTEQKRHDPMIRLKCPPCPYPDSCSPLGPTRLLGSSPVPNPLLCAHFPVPSAWKIHNVQDSPSP